MSEEIMILQKGKRLSVLPELLWAYIQGVDLW